MRNLLLLISLFLLTQSCKTYSYFKSPNDFLDKDCDVFLNDGTEMKGKLTVQFETGYTTDKQLKIIAGANGEKKIPITAVQYYKYNNELYFPKEINLEAYETPGRDRLYTPKVSNILFLKRITKEGAKLQLFELFRSATTSPDGYDHFDYYISFNEVNRFEAWSVRGNKFFPNFAEKMSQLVSDCPLLAAKVKQGEGGYTVKQISLDAKKNEVIKRIVDEYNNCK